MPKSVGALRLGLALQAARRANVAAANEPAPVPRAASPYTRRRLIRAAAAVAGVVATGGMGEPAWAAGRAPRIVVVGGGLAGLNAAYQLLKHGIRATVYEGRNRLGGRVLSVASAVEAGLVDDIGGSFVNTDHADLLRLIREFDLELYNRNADVARLGFPKTGYLVHGRLVPEDLLARDLRPLAARITRDADRLDQDYERYAPYFDRISVKQYFDSVRDKISAAYVRNLMEQTIRSEYGVEPQYSSALQLLFLLPTVDGRRVDLLSYSDELFTVRGGSGRIVEGLAAALAGQVRTGRKLVAVRSNGGGYALHFTGQHGAETVSADILVLAVPFTTLRNVDIEVELPPLLRRCIAELGLGRDEKLFAGFEGRPWRRGKGFIGEIWSDGGFAEAWEDTQRQPGQRYSVLSYLLGGAQVDQAFAASPEQVGRRFLDVLDAAIPGVAAHATGRYLRTNWHRQPLTLGSYTNFAPGQYTLFAPYRYIESDAPDERQHVRVGNIFFAGEQLSDEYYGFMNGAAQTGRLAAETIARHLGAG